MIAYSKKTIGEAFEHLRLQPLLRLSEAFSIS
ncbi:hypothetical protein PPSIR1_05123 [Plesiocystis pacifica SIR-1]|uniref:Uncharacterized protein n=1 Tax=Plesiocystis pacifica SIR-1 TaxID=391625 RepID=A6FWZ7_9BACT|nr:hypothetical protein PPSIR1_05123 [Plesiocystis pacifica SIR-1]